jgi:hypothetical protein
MTAFDGVEAAPMHMILIAEAVNVSVAPLVRLKAASRVLRSS